MKFLIDTNVLLRSDDTDSFFHRECADSVKRLLTDGHQLCICAQVMIEYWAVATRPINANGLAIDIKDVSCHLHNALETLLCLPEPDDIGITWLNLASKHNVIGKQAHDARIAAFMIAHGITHLVTLNPSDFARYPEITTVIPAEIVSNK